jgi:hypothetical protein
MNELDKIVSIVTGIRERTKLTLLDGRTGLFQLQYSQPDAEWQFRVIAELMANEIEIKLADAPVMLPEGYDQPITMQLRRLAETEIVTLPDGCDTVFIYNWFATIDLMTQDRYQMIRLAFVATEKKGKQIN